jgi:hypothetical protein
MREHLDALAVDLKELLRRLWALDEAKFQIRRYRCQPLF